MQTPGQVAKKANVTAQSVRNWTREYAAFLTPTARGEHGPRLYTDEDVQVLCTIAALRKSGVPPAGIAERLQNVEVPPVIDVALNVPSNMPQNSPNVAQGEALGYQMVYSAVEGRFEAIERRIEARERMAHLWTLGMGIWIGMVTMAAIFFAVWLAVNGL